MMLNIVLLNAKKQKNSMKTGVQTVDRHYDRPARKITGKSWWPPESITRLGGSAVGALSVAL